METGLDLTVENIDFVVERTYRDSDRYDVGNRSSCRLVFILDGDAELTFDTQKTVTDAGGIFFMPPHNDHSVLVGSGGYHFITVSFSVRENVPPVLYPIASLDDRGLSYLFSAMYTAYERKEPGWQIEIRSGIYTLLARLFAKRFCQNPEGKISKTVAYIKANYASHLTQESLAAVSGYSVPHFKKLFRDEVGTSPIRFLNEFRVNRAKDLLKSGLFRVQEVATACGFENVFYFSNAFKKHTGVSPRLFMKK